jgi:hypothetical protein
LRRSPWKHVTGVLLGPDRVVAATLVVTPIGLRPAGTAEEPVVDGEVGLAVQQLRSAGHLRGRIVFGVDARRSYAITRKPTDEEQGRNPAELLADHLGLEIDALVTISESVKLPSGMHTALAAAPRAVAADVLQALGPKPGNVRLYPLIWALYQRAVRSGGHQRKWRTEVRILRDPDGGVAILSHGGFPVASRLIDMLDDRDVGSVSLAVLGLLTHAHEELGLRAVDGVILHMDDPDKDLAQTFEDVTGLKTVIAPAVSCDPASCALALAQAGARLKADAVDFFAVLRPPPGVMRRLPLKSAAVLGIAAGVLAWMLTDATATEDKESIKLEKQITANLKRAHVQPTDLKKVHEKLKNEVLIAETFINNRVRWSEILRELPGVMPPTMSLVDFDGRDKIHYPAGKKKKKKKGSSGGGEEEGGVESTKGRQLTISGEVELKNKDSSPPEVQELSRAVAASPVFQAVLPRITGANVHLLPAVKGVFARVSLYCMPPGVPGKK